MADKNNRFSKQCHLCLVKVDYLTTHLKNVHGIQDADERKKMTAAASEKQMSLMYAVKSSDVLGRLKEHSQGLYTGEEIQRLLESLGHRVVVDQEWIHPSDSNAVASGSGLGSAPIGGVNSVATPGAASACASSSTSEVRSPQNARRIQTSGNKSKKITGRSTPLGRSKAITNSSRKAVRMEPSDHGERITGFQEASQSTVPSPVQNEDSTKTTRTELSHHADSDTELDGLIDCQPQDAADVNDGTHPAPSLRMQRLSRKCRRNLMPKFDNEEETSNDDARQEAFDYDSDADVEFIPAPIDDESDHDSDPDSDPDNETPDDDKEIAQAKKSVDPRLLKGDTYRGTTLTGFMRNLRKEHGFSEQFQWDPEGGDPHLMKFYRYLIRAKTQSKAKTCRNKVNMISKMLFWVQTKQHNKKPVEADPKVLYETDIINSFYDALSSNLDGQGRGTGLQPSAMKNEYAAYKIYLQFLKADCNYHITDKDFFGHLSHLLDCVGTTIHKNQCMIATTNTQRVAQQMNEGLKVQLEEIFYESPSVKQIVADIMEKYGPSQHDVEICNNKEEFIFFTRYLMNHLTLTYFQRSGVCAGLTMEEYQTAKANRKTQGVGLCIADHKNNAHAPASVTLRKETFVMMDVYAKRIRQQDKPGSVCSNKFFRTYEDLAKYSNVSREMKNFQVQHGMPQITANQARHCIESIARDHGDGQVQAMVAEALGHSVATARKNYSTHTGLRAAGKNFQAITSLVDQVLSSKASPSKTRVPESQETATSAQQEPVPAYDPQEGTSAVTGAPSPYDTQEGTSAVTRAPSPAPSNASSDLTSVSSAVGKSDSVLTAELRHLVFASFPVTAEDSCPKESEIRRIMGEHSLVGSDKWQQTAPKNVASQWREMQHKARAERFLCGKGIKRGNVKDMEAQIKKAFPHWTQTGKIANHALRGYQSPVKRAHKLAPTFLSIGQTEQVKARINDQNWNLQMKQNLPGRGRGVFARFHIEEGQVVCDYHAKYHTGKEGNKIYKTQPDSDSGYMFAFKHGGKNHYRDATADDGTIGRLINHSKCCNNVKAEAIDILGDGKPHLVFVAKRKILPDEEILFDYNDSKSTAAFLKQCPACKARLDPVVNLTELSPSPRKSAGSMETHETSPVVRVNPSGSALGSRKKKKVPTATLR